MDDTTGRVAELDETAAICAARTGDQAAFARFYDLLAPRVFGTILRVVRDRAMSEEVAQEVFVELWRRADRFDPDKGSAAAWALTIARRRAVDRVRREQSQRDRAEDLASLRPDESDTPDDLALAAVQSDDLAGALGRLTDDHREVITMSFLDGRSHGEIAQALDLPLGTVKGRVRGGLRSLRRQLSASWGETT